MLSQNFGSSLAIKLCYNRIVIIRFRGQVNYKTYIMTALIIVKRINYFSGPKTYLHVCGKGEVLLFLVTPKFYHVSV